MNKKGQTLLVFVILLPVCLLFLAFVIDTSLVIHKYLKTSNTMKTIIKTTFEEKEREEYVDKIKLLLEKNDIETDNLYVNLEADGLQMGQILKVESIFGKIINKNEYNIKINLKAFKKEDKIVIEKE